MKGLVQIFIKLYHCIIFEAIKLINLNRVYPKLALKKKNALDKNTYVCAIQPFVEVFPIVTFGRVNNVSTFVVQVETSYSLSNLNLEALAMHEKFLVQWEWLYFKLFQATFLILNHFLEFNLHLQHSIYNI